MRRIGVWVVLLSCSLWLTGCSQGGRAPSAEQKAKAAQSFKEQEEHQKKMAAQGKTPGQPTRGPTGGPPK